MSFRSRWVQPPAGVGEAAGLPAGFRAAGATAGIKPSGQPDLALLVADPPDTVSAARFTRSGVLAAPVLVCQERCRLDALRAVVVNAGNANAATGARGVQDAVRMQAEAARAHGRARGPGGGRVDWRDRRAARHGRHPGRGARRPRCALPGR